MTANLKHQNRRRRSQRGQAMVEYSIINYILLMALVCLATAPIFKGSNPTGTTGTQMVAKRNVIEMMLEAYQHYYDSFYLVLTMPYP